MKKRPGFPAFALTSFVVPASPVGWFFVCFGVFLWRDYFCFSPY